MPVAWPGASGQTSTAVFAASAGGFLLGGMQRACIRLIYGGRAPKQGVDSSPAILSLSHAPARLMHHSTGCRGLSRDPPSTCSPRRSRSGHPHQARGGIAPFLEACCQSGCWNELYITLTTGRTPPADHQAAHLRPIPVLLAASAVRPVSAARHASCTPATHEHALGTSSDERRTCTDGTIWTRPYPAFQKSCAMRPHSLAAHSCSSALPRRKRTLCGGRNGAGSRTARPFHDEYTWNGLRDSYRDLESGES